MIRPSLPDLGSAITVGVRFEVVIREFRIDRDVVLVIFRAGQRGVSTAFGRGRLADGRFEGFQVIFRQEPKVSGPSHFGSPIVFAPDGKLFLTTGERYKFEPAQDVSSHLGVDRHGTGTLLDFGLSI